MAKRKIDRKSEKGATAIIVAVSLLALLTIVGVSIDLLRAVYARSIVEGAMKSAVTSAAAVALSENPNSPDVPKMQSAALQRFNDNVGVNRWLYDQVAFVSSYDRNSDVLTAVVDFKVPMTFMQIWGKANIPVHLETSARRPRAAPTEIALALDVTLSMDDTITGQHRYPNSGLKSKLDELKTAATGLIDFVMASDDAMVGLVPYTNFVNVGSWRGQWLELAPNVQVNDQDCTVTKTNCVTDTNATCTNPDTGGTYTCTTTKCDVKSVCTGYRTVTFTGCVVPRGKANAKNLFIPMEDISDPFGTKYYGIASGACLPAPMMDLTGNAGAAGLKTAVNKLTAVTNPNGGTTFLPNGLIWAWNMLDPAEPLTSASSASGNTKPKKSIVLVTDGSNAAYPSYRVGYVGSDLSWTKQPQADALTAKICANIQNNTDIYVYVVAIVDTYASSSQMQATEAMLQACTQPRGAYYMVRNSSQLTDAFKQIGKAFTYNALVN